MKVSIKKILFLSVFTLNAYSIDIPDTGQNKCYSDIRFIACPTLGEETHYGQDAQYGANQPDYTNNNNGTITDNITGLMWSKSVDDIKLSLEEAMQRAKTLNLGGYTDWRVPNIKELYSLIDFRGYTGFSKQDFSLNSIPANAIPFINTDYFNFKYGAKNERYIDAQWISTTKYVSTTMGGMETLFGVNFADGRIKGYGYKTPQGMVVKKFYVRYVRGIKSYGENKFVDNKDDTLTDESTGLMWTKFDSKKGMNWEDALKYANDLKVGGYDDWRVPNAKELQYIVDYSKSPDSSNSPAIDDKFELTSIENEVGQKDYPYYWTSTTHLDGPKPSSNAVYIALGRALGKMRGEVMDVHGAGAQRSDPKDGYRKFHGPQGDVVRSQNYVLCVRGGEVKGIMYQMDTNKYPYKINIKNNKRKNSNMSVPRVSKEQAKKFIQRLDKNSDNKVSKNEFDGPKDRFSFHDENGDGYIDLSEAETIPMIKQRGRPSML